MTVAQRDAEQDASPAGGRLDMVTLMGVHGLAIDANAVSRKFLISLQMVDRAPEQVLWREPLPCGERLTSPLVESDFGAHELGGRKLK